MKNSKQKITSSIFSSFNIALILTIILAVVFGYMFFIHGYDCKPDAATWINIVCKLRTEPRFIFLSYIAIVSLPFIVLRSYHTYRQLNVSNKQADTASQAMINNAFSKAIEQLGEFKTLELEKDKKTYVPNMEVRLGALYSLEKIAKSNDEFRGSIINILSAYVRENAEKTNIENYYQIEEYTGHECMYFEKVTEDINSSLEILFNLRTKSNLFKIEFKGINLCGVNFKGFNLEGTNFSYCDIRGADFSNTKLRDAKLIGSILIDTKFLNADVTNVLMHHSILVQADFSYANLKGGKFSNSVLYEANFENAVNVPIKSIINAKDTTSIMLKDIDSEQLNELRKPLKN